MFSGPEELETNHGKLVSHWCHLLISLKQQVLESVMAGELVPDRELVLLVWREWQRFYPASLSFSLSLVP